MSNSSTEPLTTNRIGLLGQQEERVQALLGTALEVSKRLDNLRDRLFNHPLSDENTAEPVPTGEVARMESTLQRLEAKLQEISDGVTALEAL